jgi:hypothetical protein
VDATGHGRDEVDEVSEEETGGGSWLVAGLVS